MEDEDISLGLNSNEELVSVQGQDGQQYVVLEVIQLEVKSFKSYFILFDAVVFVLIIILESIQGEGGEEDEGTMLEVEGATEIEGSILEGDGNTMTSLDGELGELIFKRMCVSQET